MVMTVFANGPNTYRPTAERGLTRGRQKGTLGPTEQHQRAKAREQLEAAVVAGLTLDGFARLRL
jgi:hypothetical protein